MPAVYSGGRQAKSLGRGEVALGVEVLVFLVQLTPSLAAACCFQRGGGSAPPGALSYTITSYRSCSDANPGNRPKRLPVNHHKTRRLDTLH